MTLRSRTEGYCPICGHYGALVVNHDPNTDLIRGRICDSCNTHTMYAVDRPELLAAALRYKANPPGVPELPKTYSGYVAAVQRDYKASHRAAPSGRPLFRRNILDVG